MKLLYMMIAITIITSTAEVKRSSEIIRQESVRIKDQVVDAVQQESCGNKTWHPRSRCVVGNTKTSAFYFYKSFKITSTIFLVLGFCCGFVIYPVLLLCGL